jgi:hypothetical protein
MEQNQQQLKTKIYDQVWFTLNTKNCKNWHDRSPLKNEYQASYSAVDSFEHFKKLEPNTIRFPLISPKDFFILYKHKISFFSLLKIFQALRELLILLKMGRKDTTARQFQDKMIAESRLTCPCPFTGVLLSSNYSIPFQGQGMRSVLYRFKTCQEFFYVITAARWRGYPKFAVYFPISNLLIEFELNKKTRVPRNYIAEFKTLIVSNPGLFADYFNNEEATRKVAVIVAGSNFAHHILNELSGLQRLSDRKLLGCIETIFVFGEPLGPIESLFPEIPGHKIKRIRGDEVCAEVIKNDYFAVNLGDMFMRLNLINRVLRVANENCSNEIREKVRTAQHDCFPLLWMGVRLGNRTLTNQHEAYLKLIQTLAKHFPKLGVVFDGFSYPALIVYDKEENHPKTQDPDTIEIVQMQKRFVAKLAAELNNNNVHIYDAIGCSIFESILWSTMIDLYISPYGTMQHKAAWFGNKPGVVHSNPSVLGGLKWVIGVREDEITPRFISKKYSINAEEEILNVPETYKTNVRKRGTARHNYYIEWKVMYKELEKIARSLKRS